MQCLLMPMLLRTEERDCKKKGKRAVVISDDK